MKPRRPASARLRAVRVAVAMATAVLAIASSYAGIESQRLLAAVKHETPAATPVPASAVWPRAQAAATEIPGGRVLVGAGTSMTPLFHKDTALVVSPHDFSALRKGMTVVYRNSQGRLVAHALSAKMPQGWVAHGVANDFEDDELVTAANLVGVVVAAYSDSGVARANTF